VATTIHHAQENNMTRRIDDDCTLTYAVAKEAWYASSLDGELPAVFVMAAADGGGVKWEFDVQEYHLGGRDNLRLRIFDDALAAFEDIPEFFTALRERKPQTLTDLRALLDSLGAVDATQRALVPPTDHA
jgi:hypothetical protein